MRKWLEDNTVLFGEASEVDARKENLLVPQGSFLSLRERIQAAFIETFPAESSGDFSSFLGATGQHASFFGFSRGNKSALKKVGLLVTVPITTAVNVIRFVAEFIPRMFETVFKHLLVLSKRAWGFARNPRATSLTADKPSHEVHTPFYFHRPVRFFLIMPFAALGIAIGAALYYPLKAVRLLIRTVTSPIASFDDAWDKHPALGVLSGVVSCVAYTVAAIFLSPMVLASLAKGSSTARVLARVIPHTRKLVGMLAASLSSVGMAVRKVWKRFKTWANKEPKMGPEETELSLGATLQRESRDQSPSRLQSPSTPKRNLLCDNLGSGSSGSRQQVERPVAENRYSFLCGQAASVQGEEAGHTDSQGSLPSPCSIL